MLLAFKKIVLEWKINKKIDCIFTKLIFLISILLCLCNSLSLSIFFYVFISLSLSVTISFSLLNIICIVFLSNFGRSHPFALFWCVCCLQEGRMDRFHRLNRHQSELPFHCCPLISGTRRRSCSTFTTTIRTPCICLHCIVPAQQAAS